MSADHSQGSLPNIARNPGTALGSEMFEGHAIDRPRMKRAPASPRMILACWYA